MINCLICNEKDNVIFFDNYIHQFEQDKKYFDNSKLINDLNYLSPFFSNKWNSLR